MSGAAVKRAAVVGRPIGHSLSPAIHGAWLRALGSPHDYGAIEPGAGERFDDVVARVRAAGYSGVNVTAPFKREALRLADETDETARRIGAANLLVFQPDGRVLARNTDEDGFLAALLTRRAANAFAGRAACVLGAGGAALAVCRALLRSPFAEIRLWNRTAERARLMADAIADPRLRAVAAAAEGAEGAALIVDATSGLDPRALGEAVWTAAAKDVLVHDLKYGAAAEPLRAEAAARGLAHLDGLSMLIAQARPSFEALFGLAAPYDNQRLERMLREGARS